MSHCEHLDSPRCPRVGCLAPHGVCISEGAASAQRINAHIDEDEADADADADVRGGMRMLAFAILYVLGCFCVGGLVAAYIFFS